MKRLISLFLWTAAIGMFGLCWGCDDSDTKVPPAVLEQASKPPESGMRIPTTQDSLEMPPGWGPDHRTGMPNLIMGYTPSGGEVSIQLIPRSPLRAKDLNTMVAAAKKEMAANPTKILKCELRPLGTAQVLERQRVGDPAPVTTYDRNNKPHESIESYFEWTLDVLVPHEDGVQDNQIAFLGLTKSQYDKDKDFLNGVISTLQYVSPSESATTTTAPTATPASDALSTTQPALNTPATPIKP
jgi:hypothetical protein